MSPRPRRLLAAGTGLAALAAVAACAPQPSPEVAVRTFLLDWQAGVYEGAANQTNGDVDEVAEALEQAHAQLDLASIRFSLGGLEREGDSATAKFDATADLGIGDPVWTYTGSIPLSRDDSGWTIDWSPAVIHPELGADERLAVSYDVPDRGQIFDRNEEPLVGQDKVTAFGVVPADMEDKEEGVGALADLLEEDPGPLLNRVRSAPPEEFQPLVLMRQGDVKTSVEKKAKQIPGVETRQLKMRLNPKMAKAVIGEVAGTAEHNVSSRVTTAYQAGDTVGLNGLQNAFQQRLAGTATTEIVTLDGTGKQTGVLETWPGTESGSLTTTLDAEVQQASEAALELLPGKGYLVALDARSGEILSAAGAPGSVDNDGALTSEYQPGEAFTIVSAAASLQSGAVSSDDTVPCDQQVKVGDQTFTNPNNNGLWGTPDLALDFTYTCTTAFAGLGEKVGADALETAAADFGIGGDWRLSVPTFNGEFASPDSAAETAAAMVGQGQVKVSPLSMALVAGSVAEGAWHPPRIIAEGEDPGTDEGAEVEGPRELDPSTVKELRAMMRSAVEVSAANANVGVIPVHGQSATAEQKVDGKKTAVQWFVGYQGGLAFAVVAEVDPAQQWDQYATTAAGSFLQQLPFDYVEKLAGGEQQGGDTDSGADSADSAADPGEAIGQ
ncbi:MAG: penicillin-binding transpeptidase domain-containing protein [Nocardiopsaceae bacterium]|nr:penicillin-binding transpeptidase domain-containing protein [Nocardiopsaceae bacterium]